MDIEQVWPTLRKEALLQQENETLLAPLLSLLILQHESFSQSLGAMLSNKIQCPTLPKDAVAELIRMALANESNIV